MEHLAVIKKDDFSLVSIELERCSLYAKREKQITKNTYIVWSH